MEELINLSTQLHIIFVVLLLGLVGANIYLIKSKKTFFTLSDKYGIFRFRGFAFRFFGQAPFPVVIRQPAES